MDMFILLALYVNFFIYLEFMVRKQKLALANFKVCFLLRNSAVETVEQELLFVGSETGKLLAMRELIKKVYLENILEF